MTTFRDSRSVAITWRQVSAMIAGLAATAGVLGMVVTPVFAAQAKMVVDEAIDAYDGRHMRMLDQRFKSIEHQLDRISDAVTK